MKTAAEIAQLLQNFVFLKSNMEVETTFTFLDEATKLIAAAQAEAKAEGYRQGQEEALERASYFVKQLGEAAISGAITALPIKELESA